MPTIEVFLKDGKLNVDKAQLRVPFGQSPTITWEAQPDSGLTIDFIGFHAKVGQGHPIEIPGRQAPTRWTTVDRNQNPTNEDQTFQYDIWATHSGVMYSTDPEIVNEPQSGEAGGEAGGGTRYARS